jgi:hypothetical protein
MRSHFKVSAILMASMFISTTVVAQTGEFAATVPGEVVHRGWELQDAWQNARNRAGASQTADAPQKLKPRPMEVQETAKSRRDK